MTTTGAVSQFTDGIKYLRWILCLLVFVRLIVIGMTTCTVRLIGAEIPAYDVAIRRVTIIACDIGGVSAREERRGVCVVEHGCPPRAAVTGVTRA